jgi:hypothetical protein
MEENIMHIRSNIEDPDPIYPAFVIRPSKEPGRAGLRACIEPCRRLMRAPGEKHRKIFPRKMEGNRSNSGGKQ